MAVLLAPARCQAVLYPRLTGSDTAGSPADLQGVQATSRTACCPAGELTPSRRSGTTSSSSAAWTCEHPTAFSLAEIDCRDSLPTSLSSSGCTLLRLWVLSAAAQVKLYVGQALDRTCACRRDNVAQLVLLRPLLGQEQPQPGGRAQQDAHTQAPLLLLAQTHLLFNPKRGDIKVRHIFYIPT